VSLSIAAELKHVIRGPESWVAVHDLRARRVFPALQLFRHVTCSFITNIQSFVQQFADTILSNLDSRLSDAYSGFQEYVAEGAPLLEIVNTVTQVLDWFPSMSTVVRGIRAAVEAVQTVGFSACVCVAYADTFVQAVTV
jgi:hypothetical protein